MSGQSHGPSTPADEAGPRAIEARRRLPAQSLDLWFDYTCPYAYLASLAAPALAARMGVSLRYRPLLLGGIFRAVNVPQNLFRARGAVRSAYEAADLARWAHRFGVPLTIPAGHPMRSVEALRATLVTGVDPAVVRGFYRAYWVEGRSISEPDVMAAVLREAGHDGDAVLARIGLPDIKEELKQRTDEALAHGVFGVPAWLVDGEHLYWGQDRLAFVEGVRPPPALAEARPPSSSPRTLEVYWDFSSPFAYLGVAQVAALAARTGAKVTWHPILLGGLFRAIGTPDVPIAAFSEPKRKYLLTDLHRWAEYWQVPFRFPSRFPTRSLRALRVYCALSSEEDKARFRNAVFRAYWADDENIEDDAILARCIGDEASAREAFARSESDEIKAELRRSTEAALARGVFGVPTFVVDGELYWGQDRLELVEQALLAAPSSATSDRG
jgi:2-hydroxychromene-2-carboxylate isomerase